MPTAGAGLLGSGEPQFEVLPFARAEHEAARLPEPARLTVTCSPRQGVDQSVAVAVRLAGLGHSVVPHLAARSIRDAAHLDELLAEMARADIDEVFVIGGDSRHPEGDFSAAGELLPLIREHGVRTIGIAGYPEGHPLIEPDALASALQEKSRLADYIVTQMCFDPDALFAWLTRIRARGVSLPVRIGMPGAVHRTRLLEVSLRIGVGPSVSFVRKQRGLLQLFRRPMHAADKLLDALAPRLCEPELKIAGFHYYTLNELLDTWNWARQKQTHRKLTAHS